MRIIPKSSKVRTEFFKGFTVSDMIFIFVCALINVFILTSNLPHRFIILLVGVALSCFLMFKMDDQRVYQFIVDIVRHLSYRKKFARREKEIAEGEKKSAKKLPDITRAVAWTGIKDGFIEYGKDYYGVVLEIPPVEFRFFSEFRQTNAIDNTFAAVLRDLNSNYSANLVKVDRPVNYERYFYEEEEKINNLKEAYVNGLLTEDELRTRMELSNARLEYLNTLSTSQKTVLPFFYFVMYDSDRAQLEARAGNAQRTLETGELFTKRLNDRELALFLRYSNEIDFDESEIDEVAPEDYYEFSLPRYVGLNTRTTQVNGMLTHNFRVISYPLTVGNAWGAQLFDIPGIKIVMKFKPMEQDKAIRSIDRSLDELRSRQESTGKSSRIIELQTHIETLTELLQMLQNHNESLLQTNMYVTVYDSMLTEKTPGLRDEAEYSIRPRVNWMKKTMRQTFSELGFRATDQMFRQFEGFVGSQVSGYDPVLDESRNIHSSTVAAVYPFVYPTKADRGGMYLGKTNGVPTFFNFFRRDSEHVNSNMVIIGKSGSGKSFATKTLLANLAAENSKIFVLDPENEYSDLAHNLKGKVINAGNSSMGRINPFHIITTLEDDEGGSGGSFASHLQFLEEFFRQILPDITPDAVEYLNSLINQVYFDCGIDAHTDLSLLSPEDYPTFDDLYDRILREFQTAKSEYLRTNLRVLMNHVSKFAYGGRNSQLWNGESTITTEENFIVFDFQSLLANRNSTVSNAQMLLILKWLDNEIIKNREYNRKYNQERKIVVVIDEAHVFIDTKYPLALDFMFQLAKRIRKYNGMQIVITQNIKDFVGSEEIARKSTAIINACQYSLIFSLAPNDMNDLCLLYEKAGGINDHEQEEIVGAKRGNAFVVTSPTSRTSVEIEALDYVRDLFSKEEVESPLYGSPEGGKQWRDLIDELSVSRKESMAQSAPQRYTETARRGGVPTKRAGGHVRLVEISEDSIIPPEAPTPNPAAEPAVTQIPSEPASDFAVRNTASPPPDNSAVGGVSVEAVQAMMESMRRQFEAQMEARIQQIMNQKDGAKADPVSPVTPAKSAEIKIDLSNPPDWLSPSNAGFPPEAPAEEPGRDPFEDWMSSAADDLVSARSKRQTEKAEADHPKPGEAPAEEIKVEEKPKPASREVTLDDLLSDF